MPKQSLPCYHCPRCGYKTPRKTCMRDHMYKTKPCPSLQDDLELTAEVIEHVLSNRVYHKPETHVTTSNKLDDKLKKLQDQIDFLKTNRKESFYQTIVEEYLQGTHKKLKRCVTDVSNDRVHAEIKKWDCFLEAIGQLTYYNWVDPKEELHIYFFGRTSQKDADYLIPLLMEKGFIVHTFRDTEDGVVIHQHNKKTDVFQKIYTELPVES